MTVPTDGTSPRNKSKKKTSNLHCMINRLASRGCCLFLQGPGKGRYQRRDCHYLKGHYTHEVSRGKGGTLIIPLYCQSLYGVLMLKTCTVS